MEAGPAYQKNLSEEVTKLQRLYGGGDLTKFPDFKFSGQLSFIMVYIVYYKLLMYQLFPIQFKRYICCFNLFVLIKIASKYRRGLFSNHCIEKLQTSKGINILDTALHRS